MTWLIDERARRTPVRAASPGTLAAAEAVLDLPDMSPVVGRMHPGSPGAPAQAWIIAGPVAEPETTWRRWAREFDRTGLWPLMTSGVDGRPFRTGELGHPAEPADPAAVLRAGWRGLTPVRADGTVLPQPAWPGLAPGRGAPDERGVVLRGDLTSLWRQELLLVPARQPADAVAQLGWHGACNWSLTGAAVAGVLRSWEERFGAYAVAIGFATVDLVVTRPPATATACDLLASEHLAFCPDNFSPQDWPPQPPIPHDEYADRLRTATTWHFWWD